MSWLNSSFSFAKSALSQAQQSIDKVLDIKEEQAATETANEGAVRSKSFDSPSVHATGSLIEHQPETKSALPSLTRPASQQQNTITAATSSSTTSPNTNNASSFDSTWATGGSFWNSYLSSSNSAEKSKSTPQEFSTVKSNKPSPGATKGGVKKKPLSSSTPTRRTQTQTGTPLSHLKLNSPAASSTPLSDTSKPKKEQVAIIEPVPEETVSAPSPFSDTSIPKEEQVVIKGSALDKPVTPLDGGEIVIDIGTSKENAQSETVSISESTHIHHSEDSSQITQSISTPEPPSDYTDSGKSDVPIISDDVKPVHSDDVTPLVSSPTPNTKDELQLTSEPNITDDTSPPPTADPLPSVNLLEHVREPQKLPQEPDQDEPVVSIVETTEDTTEVTPVLEDPSTSSKNPTKQSSSPQQSDDGIGGAASKVNEEEMQTLTMELSHVRQLLEARELKMVDMSRENISLMETNQSLQRELSEAKETGESDVTELRSEFTRRIATSEKKLQGVLKERDSLKKQLQAQHDEHTQMKQSEGDQLTKQLKEKDEQIAQLMEEGEKLSKQELQSNSIIKKLRQKDRQNDQLLSAQRQQIEDFEGKIKNLKEQLKKKDETERKYQESLAQLNTIAEQQAKELALLKSERDELTDKVRSLQSNLDNKYKELAQLQKANAVTQSAAQEAALSAEQSTREELKSVLEQEKTKSQREKETLLIQLDELRMSVTRAEQQAAWREDHMRQELADMQQRLQEAESRNQELTSTISQATKPLLRQIENLQTAHSTQSANWEKVESSLTQRLVEAQTQLSLASEKERVAVEKELTHKSRITTLEAQLTSVRQEKSHLLASLELERAKLETLEEGQQRDSAKMEALRASYQKSVEELQKEKAMLERQLEYERVRLEAESKKACLESQEKERLRAQLANSLSSLNRTVSRQSSSGNQGEILEKSLLVSESGGSVSELSIHGGRMASASASVIERLQSLLKQKEGELTNAQNFVGSLERSRSAMAEDLASLSAQNETLKQKVETIPPLEDKLEEVERKHEAMLQMYGEKAEQAEELKLDIEDLKLMYKQQIEELLGGKR